MNQGATQVDLGPQQPLPPINNHPEQILDDIDVVIQPQGSTKRPKVKLPSLADLPSTTPRPSPLLQGVLQTVPGTNQGTYHYGLNDFDFLAHKIDGVLWKS